MFIELFYKVLYYFRRIVTVYCLLYAGVYYMNGDTFIADIYLIAFCGWLQTILLEDK